jgi:hypothetical protein
MRELRCAVSLGIPLVALLEEPAKGGASVNMLRKQLVAADALYEKWGFDDDGPRGAALADVLFAEEPLEWNRIGAFQEVTMRLISERLLPASQCPTFMVGGDGQRDELCGSESEMSAKNHTERRMLHRGATRLRELAPKKGRSLKTLMAQRLSKKEALQTTLSPHDAAAEKSWKRAISHQTVGRLAHRGR